MQPSTVLQNLRHPFAVSEVVSLKSVLLLHSPSMKHFSVAKLVIKKIYLDFVVFIIQNFALQGALI